MRTVIRYTLTVIAFILAGLAIYTAETVVDEAGYTEAVRAIVREGWAAVVEAGYADWVSARLAASPARLLRLAGQDDLPSKLMLPTVANCSAGLSASPALEPPEVG